VEAAMFGSHGIVDFFPVFCILGHLVVLLGARQRLSDFSPIIIPESVLHDELHHYVFHAYIRDSACGHSPLPGGYNDDGCLELCHIFSHRIDSVGCVGLVWSRKTPVDQ